MEVIFPKGFQFEFAGLKYEKLDDTAYSWWVCLNSKYRKEERNDKGEITYCELHPESEKTLFRDNRLNRWGFKVPDHQVITHYNL